MKYITIFIDFEGSWGMPHKRKYDLVKTTERILGVLKKYNVKATFNTCGIIVEKHPQIIGEIHKNGHEISVHGFTHKDFNNISTSELEWLLEKTEKALKKLTGLKPVGFRIPYLLGPTFFNHEIYKLFEDRGYLWASNREIRYVDEIIRPDRINNNLLAKIYSHFHQSYLVREFFYLLINYRLVVNDDIGNVIKYRNDRFVITENVKSRLSRNFTWLRDGKTIFKRNKIFEIPLLSPLDCDCLGLPDPNITSEKRLMDFTYRVITNEYHRSGIFFNINLHDWIIGTSNRLQLLDDILSYLTTFRDAKFVTGSELISMVKKYV